VLMALKLATSSALFVSCDGIQKQWGNELSCTAFHN